VRVRLIGELAHPFAEPEAISEDFTAQAVSESRIEVPIAERTLRERFGRATFRGRVEVREDAQWEGEPGAVLGRRTGVVIDFVPPRVIDTSERALDRMLGVTWASESPRGLTILTIAPESRALALGLAPGDALLGDGVATFVPGDAPVVPIGATTLSLVMARDGQSERTVGCAIGDRHEDDALRDRVWLMQLAIVLIWIALLGAFPLVSIDYAAPRPAAALGRPSAAVIARAACSIALAYGLVRVVAGGALPSAPIVIAAIAGLRAALKFADARGDVKTLPATTLASLGLAAGLALIPIAQGTADFGVLARDQARSVLEWPLFAQPVGPLALLLVGVSIGAVRIQHRVLRVVDDCVVLVVATLAILEGTGLAPTSRAAIVALSLSIALATWLLAHVRGRVSTLASTVSITLLVALAAACLGAWTFADPSALVRRAAAETVLAMCVTLALFVARRAMTPRVPARASHALL
jgi:hypothetical protein